MQSWKKLQKMYWGDYVNTWDITFTDPEKDDLDGKWYFYVERPGGLELHGPFDTEEEATESKEGIEMYLNTHGVLPSRHSAVSRHYRSTEPKTLPPVPPIETEGVETKELPVFEEG